ncbi:MAG TPA: DNA starvation/stationary phase protection protein [Burkholderiaceae bacterium]|nr:DNA starvation/stationary phase protection protein [Burkholderiaceae bacterium]
MAENDNSGAFKNPADIGIAPEERSRIVRILNALLADEVLLYVKTRNFHWNVEGPSFSEMHKFFEAQYEQLDEILDEVAERARAIDGRAAGSMREFLQLARLKESPDDLNWKQMVETLLADHQALIRQMRADIQTLDGTSDAGTEDFITGLIEAHEKMAWMLRSYTR